MTADPAPGARLAAVIASTFKGFPTAPTTPPAAVSIAASRLRQWTNRTHAQRPTRDELRADVEQVLDERVRLYDETAELRGALRDARERGDALAARLEKALAQRDGVQVDRDDLLQRWTRMKAERDSWHDEADARAAQLDELEQSAAFDDAPATVTRTCEHGVTIRVTLRDGAS